MDAIAIPWKADGGPNNAGARPIPLNPEVDSQGAKTVRASAPLTRTVPYQDPEPNLVFVILISFS